MNPSCAVCGKVLAGRAAIDLWGNVYCAEHRGALPDCTVCGRLICARLTGGGSTYPDGRAVCNLCRQTAVDTKEQAKPLVEGVARWLYEHGVRFDGLILKVALEDARAIARHRQLALTPGRGYVTGYISETTERRNEQERRIVNGITLLSGLPRVFFEGVTAHELGHAWLYLAHVDGLEPWAEEGFCNLLRYALHKNRTSAEDAHWVIALEKNPDPVYGEGLRRVHAIFKQHGFVAALRYTFEHKRLPPE